MVDIIPVTKQLGVPGFQKVSLQIVKCLHSLSRLTRLRNRSGASEIVFLIFNALTAMKRSCRVTEPKSREATYKPI